MTARFVSWLLRALVPFQTGEERDALATLARELGEL
jgi:hypothetical protein